MNFRIVTDCEESINSNVFIGDQKIIGIQKIEIEMSVDKFLPICHMDFLVIPKVKPDEFKDLLIDLKNSFVFETVGIGPDNANLYLNGKPLNDIVQIKIVLEIDKKPEIRLWKYGKLEIKYNEVENSELLERSLVEYSVESLPEFNK